MINKVSIVTPCFNVEKYISKFLDSILEQDYTPLEIILVNDGSTDSTEKIIKKYISKNNRKDVEMIYIFQVNSGQAVAVETGLKKVTGEFLIWPDSDDFLLPGSIKKRVEFMKKNPQCGIMRSNGYIYDEKNLTKPLSLISKIKGNNTIEQFLKFEVPWASGCYMIRVDCLDQVNPKRELFHSKCGQNIQMILPLVYKYKCLLLDEPLYAYVIHSDSHSHKQKNYYQQKESLLTLEKCVENTLKQFTQDYDSLIFINVKFIYTQLYKNAWMHREKNEMSKFEEELKQIKNWTICEIIMKYGSPSRLINVILRIINYIKRKLRY